MPQRSYKTKLKISQTMQGTSNFAGKEHSIGSKAKISTGRGKRNPIGTKKWFVHNDSGDTTRKTQNPGGLFRRGRIAGRSEGIEMNSFIDWINEAATLTPRDKKENEKAFMLKMIARKKEREAEADREVTRQETDKIRPQQAARKAAGRKLVDPKTGAEVGKQQKGIGPTPIPKGIKIQKVAARRLPKRRKILQAGDYMLDFTEFLLEDEKKFYYKVGHDKAMAGDERGETSDNYGPMAVHYNAGYDAGKEKRKKTKPNVVGKDSYGRSIIKVG